LKGGSTDGIAWPELVNRLAERIEVAEWIRPIWRARDEELFTSAHKMAEFLLLREFSRRPKRANSVETLGVARLRHPAVDRLTPQEGSAGCRRRIDRRVEVRHRLRGGLTQLGPAHGSVQLARRMRASMWHKPRLRPV